MGKVIRRLVPSLAHRNARAWYAGQACHRTVDDVLRERPRQPVFLCDPDELVWCDAAKLG